jgi:hypothetical protein
VTRRRVVTVWLVTRALLVVLLLVPVIGGERLFADMKFYETWGRGIAEWSRLPFRDFVWEYPPGAALVVTPPAFFGPAYRFVFVPVMLLADYGTLAALVRLGDRLGSDRGVRLWLAGIALMGPIVLGRFDTVSAWLAVLALLAIAEGAAIAAGVALAGGFVTKLWPALLLVVVPYVSGRVRLLAAAGVTVALTVLAVVATGGAEHGGELVHRHTGRGLQVEAIVATPLVIAQRAGAAVDISHYKSSGSWDVTGTGTSAALTAASVLSLLALALIALLAWRARRAPETYADLAAVALLLLTVTGKVLSPQYVIWLLALLAAALCRRGSPLGVPAAIVAGCGVLGQYVYPAYYIDLVNGDGLPVVVVLVLRNVLLLVAAALAVRALWRSTATP